VSEPAGDPGAPFLGRDRTAPQDGYRRVIGAHRAPGLGGPSRGYLFTVALLAGTASMPILAAISTGSATVGNSALPDNSTPFIPTPSVGPVVVPLPDGTQPPLPPGRTPGATGVPRPVPVLAPAAPALPDDRDLGAHQGTRPAVPAHTPGPVRATPTASPRPPRVPPPSPSPSPSASEPATPDPSPSPTGEPTSTLSGPTGDPPTTAGPEPTPTDSAGSPSSTGAPEDPPASTAGPAGPTLW